LQALLGAMTGAPIVFGWPAFFYLKACRDRGRRLARVDAVLCTLYLGVLMPLLTVGGTVSAVSDIWRDAQRVKPFSC
jgi:vesicular inhibitory amino acid transporter